MHRRVVARADREGADALLREVLGFHVDQAAAEVGGHVGREVLADADVVDERGGEQVHLEAVPVGVQARNFHVVEEHFRVAVAQTANEHVLAIFDRYARHAAGRFDRGGVAGLPNRRGADAVEHRRRLPLHGHHGRLRRADGLHAHFRHPQIHRSIAQPHGRHHHHRSFGDDDVFDRDGGVGDEGELQGCRSGGNGEGEGAVEVGGGSAGRPGHEDRDADHGFSGAGVDDRTAHGSGLGGGKSGPGRACQREQQMLHKEYVIRRHSGRPRRSPTSSAAPANRPAAHRRPAPRQAPHR